MEDEKTMGSDNVIDLTIVGIKCDNESCDYDNNDVKFSDYEQWLNKPCPECGENLLTEADLEVANEMIDMANMLNSLGLDVLPTDERVEVELKMKGDGSVEIGDINAE